ncbi:MAG: metalloregulator ArsR/SmtB family transcription factor [Spirochaetia bacterium]|nr:metalloregulator ArsR/SmtB family transcription factor [Spirochaetia bacterium]
MNESEQNWGEFFKALSDEQRIRVLMLIFIHESGLCVCELTDALLLPQYKVSRQLAVLRNAGFVESEKKGLWVYYKLAKGHSVLRAVIAIIRKNRLKPGLVHSQAPAGLIEFEDMHNLAYYVGKSFFNQFE